MTKQAGFKRRVRARMAKTGESYATARSGLLAGQPGTTPDDSPFDWMPEALHISNGDATDVRGTGLARRVVYWRDILHEGPVPEVAPAELRRIRAGYLTGYQSAKRAEIMRTVDRTTGVHLTGTGARVLAGQADQIALNGIDRWIGGVHLQGRHVPWRWDDGTETIVDRGLQAGEG
jgi:hypothetical protein